MRKICINNNKGGSLKTTTTTNLAGVLVKEGHKVLIVDTDNQSNVCISFGVNPDELDVGLYDVLIGSVSPAEALVNVHPKLDILPATDDLVGFDFEVIGNAQSYPKPFSVLKNALASLTAYDYVLLDTPPSLSLMVGNVFAYADDVLIPYPPETYSMRSLIKVIDTIDDFKKEINPELNLMGVFGTMVSNRTVLHSNIMQSTRRYAIENGIHMFDTYIPASVRFASSVAFEKLPATMTGEAKGQVFYELWDEIKERGGF